MALSEEVSSSYPPPPPWYKDFSDTMLLQQKPPPIPQCTFTCFGVPCVPSQVNNTSSNLPPLDSNTRLYDVTKPLKEEFRVLFEAFSQCSKHVILMLSQMEPLKHQDLKSNVQHIIKLQKNLQHILSLLQEWEAKDELVSRLEAQVLKKRQILEALEKTLSPLL